MRKLMRVMVVALAAPVILVMVGAQSDAHTLTPWHKAKPSPVIYEDDPRWDCRTMGNRVCGVPGADGAWYFVQHDAKGMPVSVERRTW